MPGRSNIKRFFESSEITGTASAQSTAHRLGYTPRVVIAYPTEDTGVAGTLDLLEGAHDQTNVIVTAPATLKYRIKAW